MWNRCFRASFARRRRRPRAKAARDSGTSSIAAAPDAGDPTAAAARALKAGDPSSRSRWQSDPVLQNSIDALAVPGVLIGHRLISHGDELALLPEELRAFANSVDKVKRASGAARIVARRLMAQLGQPQQAVPKAASGAPVWPPGLGRLAGAQRSGCRRGAGTTNGFFQPGNRCGARRAARRGSFGSGRNREPSARAIADDPYGGRLLFAVKEAVYKAVYPLDGVFLEHHDVEVNSVPRAPRRPAPDARSGSATPLPATSWCWPLSEGSGAGEGNRTLVCSLGSCRSTIELRPQRRLSVGNNPDAE